MNNARGTFFWRCIQQRPAAGVQARQRYPAQVDNRTPKPFAREVRRDAFKLALVVGIDGAFLRRWASTAQQAGPVRPAPTVADFAYGEQSPRQKLDFWQAESEQPTPVVLLIHGGGWTNGDKTSYDNRDIRPYLEAGISVAALNYRFIPRAMEQQVEPPVKACVGDAARALQTIRSKAQEWNVDAQRIGATGTSAALYLSVAGAARRPRRRRQRGFDWRESSRLTCAGRQRAQTFSRSAGTARVDSNAIYGGHAFGFATRGRSRADEFELLLAQRDSVLPWIKEYSPIELVSPDDPPIYLDYPNQKAPPVVGQNELDPTHSAIYGIKLAEKLSRPV